LFLKSVRNEVKNNNTLVGIKGPPSFRHSSVIRFSNASCFKVWKVYYDSEGVFIADD
jgi:hypothetical protein